MNYIGEHLLPGKIGHLFLLLSLVASFGATVCYFLSVRSAKNAGSDGWQNIANSSSSFAWKRLARIFFITEAVSVFAVFATLFLIINNHYFEYKYAWQHSSLALEKKYLLSCFWEGQEGSFLLWSIWHCVLGLVVIWKEKEWEAPVMTTISFAQVLLATMLLGPFIFGWQIGSNPFVLLRNSSLLENAPVFHDLTGAIRQDYLSLIKDGNDLNPLLQNYWMVIHPPVLFLGFASTIVPFAFAVGGLWTKKYSAWTKPVLPWTLFSGAVLGTGIMMGAAWAYESLNFGGYWAWDPVENASLVPWLILVAGLHTLVIYRHTGNALRTTFFFLLLSFLFVLYSTYLTRSGDLQETSVHAFTGEGITKWHLRILLILFMIPGVSLFISRYKSIPFIAKEEETSSREFWMFIGSLVIFLSALLIIVMTSIPIFNIILHLVNGKEKTFTPIAQGENMAYSYNQIQIFVAIILGIFTGFGFYLKYKKTGTPFLKKLILPIAIGVLAGIAVVYFGEVNYREKTGGYMIAIWVAVVAAVFSVIANGSYILSGFRRNLQRAGGTVAHLGFALLLLGILISSSKKEVLSFNTSGIFIPIEEKNKIIGDIGENMTLIKGVKMDMGRYWVTYDRDSLDVTKGDKWFYHLNFESKDKLQNFSIAPNAFINHKGNMGLSANPDSKHYLTYDVFTYITSLPNKKEDTATFRPETAKIGDTIFYANGLITLDTILFNPPNTRYHFTSSDTALMAVLTVHSKQGPTYQSRPVLKIKNNTPETLLDSVYSQNLAIAFTGFENDKSAKFQIKESESIMDFITIKSYKFPYINLVWAGTIIMVLGFIISLFYRRSQSTVSAKRLKIIKSEQKKEVV